MAVEGRGRVTVGGQVFSFRPRDIFVIPNWTPTRTRFCSASPTGPVDLFREQRGNEGRRVA
jgi:gentisate 1,2-dioxygenase